MNTSCNWHCICKQSPEYINLNYMSTRQIEANEYIIILDYKSWITYDLYVMGVRTSTVGMETDTGYIAEMNTCYQLRRRGYASTLLRELVKDWGHQELWLQCGTPYYEIYERVGFVFSDAQEMIRLTHD